MKKNLFTIFISTVVGFSIAPLIAFAFIEPVDFPPGDSTSAPILTGPGTEVRKGPLTIEGNVNALAPLITANSELVTSDDVTITNGAHICLNGDCINAWAGVLEDFVRLSPPDADSGFIHLQGGATFRAATDADFGLYTRAIAPASSATYGFYGKSWTGPATAEYSYGVLGVAAHEGVNPGALAYGLFGWNGDNVNAYAGYFTGNVQVVNNSEICLTDGVLIECRSTWPYGAPGEEFLLLQNAWPTTTQAGNTAVVGNAQFANALLGDPSTGTITCGDGFCSEDPPTCPADCPVITNINASWQSATSAQFTWTTNTPMNSVVHYGLTDEYGGRNSDSTFVTSHTLVVNDVDSAEEYHFRVGGFSETSGAATFSSDQILPAQSVDIEPPAVPTDLSLDVHIPPPSADENIGVFWSHNQQDNPGGSGFKEFRIYRMNWVDGPPFQLIGTSTTPDFLDIDPELTQSDDYSYRVTAVDNADNESDPFERAIHIPLRCINGFQCFGGDPGFPNCCVWDEGGLACSALGCGGGGSPVMLKEDPPPVGLPPCFGQFCD